ncbi:MAG: DUF2071 domain-containing protein [Sphingobacteriaceae bacterium]|nr:MAG: DUF2071 domain-containing protein [Sphingobacteriaceae bacterium]
MRFLQAEWKNLLMLNYEVDPELLKPYLPAGTELDLWQGKALVSVVGFMFLNTKVLGIKWPWHINFEEANLRFYVKRFDGKEWKRGAVFISEIVPKYLIPIIANNLYNEQYQAMPMRHKFTALPNKQTEYLYEWKFKNHWNTVSAVVADEATVMEPNGAEAFIFEHYWGYNKFNDKTTLAYQVEHPSWKIKEVISSVFDANIKDLYGAAFEPYLKVKPFSAFFAEGSEVAIRVAGKFST